MKRTRGARPAVAGANKALGRDLLEFAIRRISRETRELFASHRQPDTRRVPERSIRAELRENRVWLRQARKAARF